MRKHAKDLFPALRPHEQKEQERAQDNFASISAIFHDIFQIHLQAAAQLHLELRGSVHRVDGGAVRVELRVSQSAHSGLRLPRNHVSGVHRPVRFVSGEGMGKVAIWSCHFVVSASAATGGGVVSLLQYLCRYCSC
jgi:hypothetical protein